MEGNKGELIFLLEVIAAGAIILKLMICHNSLSQFGMGGYQNQCGYERDSLDERLGFEK